MANGAKIKWPTIMPLLPAAWNPVGHPHPTPEGAYFVVNVPIHGNVRGNIIVEYVDRNVTPSIRPVDMANPRRYPNKVARALAEKWAQQELDAEAEALTRAQSGDFDPPEHTDTRTDDL